MDAAIVREVLRVLEPGAVEAAVRARQQKTEKQDDLLRALGLELQSVRYQAERAERLSGSQADDTAAALSAKEQEVYDMLGRGEGTFEIAAAMGISTHTVESYYARIQLKLGLEGMYKLRRHAIDRFRQQSN